MQLNLRWLGGGILIAALAIPVISQDLPKNQKPTTQTPSNSTQPSAENGQSSANTSPDQQDRNHRNDAITRSDSAEKGNSTMQQTAPAAQNNADQARQRVNAQTSSDRGARPWSAGEIWSLVVIGILIVLYAVVRRGPTQRPVERRDVRNRDIDRAA